MITLFPPYKTKQYDCGPRKYCLWHQAYADENVRLDKHGHVYAMTIVTGCGHEEICTKGNRWGELLKERVVCDVKCPFCHKLINWRNVYGGEGEME